MPIKLRDLAREVGVHPSTVSRVLSGDPSARLADAKRARILALAAETGYRPNRLARSLKTQRTQVLGMLIPDITNPLFSSMVRAVEDAAGQAGYNVILCNTDDREDRFRQHASSVSDGHVDAVLIATARRVDPGIDALRARGLPYVLVNRRRDSPDDSYVIADDRAGTRAAITHLVSLGHRRIAHLAGAPDISTASARREAYRRALADYGLALEPDLIVDAGLSQESGERAMCVLLRLPVERWPTAVFAVNDLVALGAIAAARAAGMRVPEDVSVVGYNDTPLVGQSPPGLTTVRVPIYEMGCRATRALIERLECASSAEAAQPTGVTMPTQLVMRGSTAVAPAARPIGMTGT